MGQRLATKVGGNSVSCTLEVTVLPPEKAKGLEPLGDFPKDSRPFIVRAMQDSNLRPLAPEANALSS